MIPEDLLVIATDRVRIEFRERRDSFQGEIGRIKGELTRTGSLHSGWAVQRLTRAIRSEYDIRGMLAWQIFSRVLSGEPIPIDQEFSRTLKERIHQLLVVSCGDLEKEYDFVVTKIGIGTPRPISELRNEVLEKLASEIDISLLGAKRTQAETGVNTIVNIYQPYGIVQTGAGSTASFVQQIDPQKLGELQRALDLVQQLVDSRNDLATTEQAQIIEIVSETRAEMVKPSPNVLKIRGALSTLATSVQTLGSASGAYQALKGAAAFFGVHLP